MPKLSFLSARAFDAGLAALAAVSAGFVTFAMPEALFSGLVETSRLPQFVPAAQPPLGETARLAAAGAAALLTFAATWALMAALNRRPAAPRPVVEPATEAPKLRRADAHPDAPARRPLLARDLGEPLDLQDFQQDRADPQEPAIADGEHRPLPSFLVAQSPEADPTLAAGPDSVPSEPWQDEPEWAQAEPEAEAETEAGPQPEAQPQPLPLSDLAGQLPESDKQSDQSLSQIVNRIEFGLARKRQALPAAAELPTAAEAPADQEKVGHRLRSAINDLQKIASTGG